MGSFKTRFIFFIFATSIVILSVSFRYAYVMLYLSVKDPVREKNYESKIPRRGDIYDRNGNIVAIDTKVYNLTCWTPNIVDKDVLVNTLSKILNLSKTELEKKFENTSGEVYIKRKLSTKEAEAVRKYKNLKCLSLKEDSQRVYPNLHLGAPVVGFVGIENKGLEGIEYTFDSYLLPKGKNSLYGNNIYLTLDLDIQEKIESVLDKTVIDHNPDSAIVMVMNAKTGEILAMGNRPSYNPNSFGEFPEKFRKNYSISQIYEPGSVFKVFTLASFYQLGGINENTLIDASDSYRNPKIPQPITDLSNYGLVTPEKIIAYSSNVGMAYASDTVDSYSFYYMLRNFGFGQETGITLNGEQSGILEEIENWNLRTKPTIAFGQAIGTTAIQLTTAATVFANQGELLKPIIVNKITSENGKVLLENSRQVARPEPVLSPYNAKLLLSHMKTVSEPGGTGWRVRIPNLNISIKTGTAQISSKGKKEIDSKIGYSSSAFLASSIALVPTEDPEYIVYIAIDYPKGKEYLGGIITPPVVKEIISYLINYSYIPRQGDEVYYINK